MAQRDARTGGRTGGRGSHLRRAYLRAEGTGAVAAQSRAPVEHLAGLVQKESSSVNGRAGGTAQIGVDGRLQSEQTVGVHLALIERWQAVDRADEVGG